MKKYELTNEFIEIEGRKLYRIRALKSFGNVSKGELGGYIESEENLSHSGNAWVYNNAKVYDDARIMDNAMIREYAKVFGEAIVMNNARVYGNSKIYGSASIFDDARVYGNAEIYNCAKLKDDASVSEDAKVYDMAIVYGGAEIYGCAEIRGHAWVTGCVDICCNADISEDTHFLNIGPIGSRDSFVTFFITREKEIFVSCGCFEGNIDEFEKAVEAEHVGTKHEKTYKLAIKLAKEQLELEK